MQLTIQSKIKNKSSSRVGKSCPTVRSASRASKVGRVRPAADGDQDFQLAMFLLQQEQLLDATVDIVASLIPRVISVVLLDIRPAVGQVPANASLIEGSGEERAS